MANTNGNAEFKSDVFDLVREYHATNNFTDLKGSIRQAIDQCIREDILREFLIEHRQEVEKMLQLDYTFERQIELERQEARKSGEEVGRKLGEEEKLRELIRKKLLKAKTLEQIAEDLEEKPNNIRPLYKQIREELADSQSKEPE